MSSLTFEFPKPLSEKYRPRTIAEFVGLEKPKRIMSKLVKQPKQSSWLFVGPSGVGKTTMALALAAELPAELHHIPSQQCNVENLANVRRICQYVPAAGFKMHMILIDEIDQMTPAAQFKMLSYLDSTDFPPNTIIIGTANATDRLEQRLISRFLPVEFSSYGIAAEATELLQTIWDRETDNPVERPNFARIVKDSCNNVRESLMRLEVQIMSC